jgi:hypothetical protein
MDNFLKYIALLIIILTAVILITCNKNKKMNTNGVKVKDLNEGFTNLRNIKYDKIPDTVVPILKDDANPKFEGNLEQCQEKCNLDDSCIGFVRNKVADNDTKGKCSLIKNIINCHNEFKEPSDKYLVAEAKSLVTKPQDYQNYDTYFKENMESDNILKCIRLEQMCSLVSKIHPFSYLILDQYNDLRIVQRDDLVEDKLLSDSEKFYSKYGVFEIVRGLIGTGISLKTTKYGEDFYLVLKREGEHIKAEPHEDTLVYKNSASFKIEMELIEESLTGHPEVRYISIIHIDKGVKRFWKLNSITNKISIVSEEDAKNSIDNCLFEMVEPLSFIPEPVREAEVPAPTIEEEVVDEDELNEMGQELETLELDIRKAQHEQNLKLMNIMLDVNKFKLHDLSMSNYLRTCTRTSGEYLAPSDSGSLVNSIMGNNNQNSNNSNNDNLSNKNNTVDNNNDNESKNSNNSSNLENNINSNKNNSYIVTTKVNNNSNI